MKETSVLRGKGISGSTLKLIAVICMLIDHTGDVLVWPWYLRVVALYGPDNSVTTMIYNLYFVMRAVIGRMAFPIFCFLLVEGFLHTSSVFRYALRLLLFALISEIPFDLAFNDAVLEFGYQNIFFTLFFGLMVIYLMDQVERRAWSRYLKVIFDLIIVAAGVAAGQILSFDYYGFGILCIAVLYILRRDRMYQVLGETVAIWAGALVFLHSTSETMAPLGMIPVYFYNGQRGLKLKYFFYLIYPIHLLLLCVLRFLIFQI